MKAKRYNILVRISWHGGRDTSEGDTLNGIWVAKGKLMPRVKIPFIKAVRALLHSSLLEAKNIVDASEEADWESALDAMDHMVVRLNVDEERLAIILVEFMNIINGRSPMALGDVGVNIDDVQEGAGIVL